MNYVILDLEFNGTYSKRRHRFVNEIIEFGAVKLDEQLHIIDTFSQLVTPQISKKLNTHVSELTHLTIEQLNSSHKTFTHVYSRFKKFLGDSVLLSWGTSDVLVLMENCRYYMGDEQIPGLCRYCNLQIFCQDALRYTDRAHQMGLSGCAERVGIVTDTLSLHRALTDAELSAMCFQKLYDAELLEANTYDVDDEFYRRITFKKYNLYDIRDPLIDRKEMYFDCDRCGRRTHRKTKWHVKNKSFRARFRCAKCRREFEGRITFKKHFDYVEVDRRIVELKPPEPKEKDKSTGADAP